MTTWRKRHPEKAGLFYFLPLFFLALWLLTRILAGIPDFEPVPNLLSFNRSVLLGLTIVAVFGPVFLVIGFALAGKARFAFDNDVLLFMGFAAFGAMGMEIVVNSAWSYVFGRPIWTYHVLPLHGGDTSLLGLIGWPLYGLYLYMLHKNLGNNPKIRMFDTPFCKSILVGMDAMVVEIGLNLLSIVAFGSFIFYYHASEFSHFTALEIFPIYIVIGWFVLWLLEKLKSLGKSRMLGAALYLSAIALAVLGLDQGGGN